MQTDENCVNESSPLRNILETTKCQTIIGPNKSQ